MLPKFVPVVFCVAEVLSSFAVADELPETGKRDEIKPRNVVFVLTDDHRYDAMGFMGHPFLETPHLDSSRNERLASPQPGRGHIGCCSHNSQH